MENTPNTNTLGHKVAKGLFVFIFIFVAILSIAAGSYIAALLCAVGTICIFDSLYLKIRPKAQAGSGFAFAFFAFIIALVLMVSAFSKQDSEQKEADEKAKYEALTPAEKEQLQHEKELKENEEALQEKIKKSFNSWDGSHRGLVKFVKEHMNDPNSFEHVKTTYIVQPTGYLIVKMEYRGKNGFGALVLNNIGAECDLDGNVTQILQP